MNRSIYFFTSLLAFIGLQSGAFAQEGESMPAHDQGMWQTLIMIAIALVFFYFILWRPEQQRRKVIEQQRNALKKGDRVTAVGIIGTVLRVQEHTVILKMYDGSKIEVIKGAITDVIGTSEEEAKKADKDERNASAKRVDMNDIDQ